MLNSDNCTELDNIGSICEIRINMLNSDQYVELYALKMGGVVISCYVGLVT